MRVNNYLFILTIFFFGIMNIQAQNPEYARELITKLTSPSMHGRGYLYKGDSIAADYIAKQFDSLGLSSFGNSYLQHFSFPINTIPGKVFLSVNNIERKPGYDYVISCSSKSTKKTYKVLKIGLKEVSKKRDLKKLIKMDLENTLLLLDNKDIKEKEPKELLRFIHQTNPFKAGGVFMIVDTNVSWRVSDCHVVNNFISGTILRSAVAGAETMSVEFGNSFINQYNTANVFAYVKGREKPDSFIVFMAHYDHLGQMGDSVMFPGANDNASGTATVIDLARYYASLPYPPSFSIAFLLFSGEEAGLLGSTYFTANPLFPLSNIRFAVNLDMVGTGSEGIRVVNGSINTFEFDILKTLNDSFAYFPQLSARGESNNSDHYPFHAKGVKSFFIYTVGKEHMHYHNPFDVEATLPLTGFENLVLLLKNFANQLQYYE